MCDLGQIVILLDLFSCLSNRDNDDTYRVVRINELREEHGRCPITLARIVWVGGETQILIVNSTTGKGMLN